MPLMPKYQHTCIIEEGDLAGNTYIHEVDAWEIEYGATCANCGEDVIDLGKIVAHIYQHLTEEKS